MLIPLKFRNYVATTMAILEKTIEEKLNHVEAELAKLSGSIAHNNSAYTDFDLIEIITPLWHKRISILLITCTFGLAGTIYSWLLPNLYTSSTILAQAQADSAGGLTNLAAKYGGLASLAGLQLGNSDSLKTDQAIILLNSRPFLEHFFTKYDLKPAIMAIDNWDKEKSEIHFDTSLYNPQTNSWTTKNDKTTNEPSNWKTYKKLRKLIGTHYDTKSALLTISIEHNSPETAKHWLDILTKELNLHFQKKDVAEATNSIRYLNEKAKETSKTGMQNLFYKMIEEQTKKLMLAEVGEEYLFKIIVPPTIPEEKSNPKRALITLLSAAIGLLLSITYTLFIKREKEQ